MKELKLWFTCVAVAVVATVVPFEQPLSADQAATDFGSCVIHTALNQAQPDTQAVQQQCQQQFDAQQTLPLNPWANVGQCYDQFQQQATNQAAALLVFRGCSWYFKEQQA